MLTILWIAVTVLVTLVILYLSPFFLSPLIKLTAWLGGFYLGRRKRKALLSYAATPGSEGTAPELDLAKTNPQVEQEIQNEYTMLENNFQKQEKRLEDDIDELRTRITAVESKSEKKKGEIKQQLVSKAFEKTKEQFSQETGKNILFLVIIAAILLCDTIIARQIFKSFGLGTEILRIREHAIEYAWIFGVFVTFISALVLHTFWDFEKFKAFVKTKWSPIVALLTIATIFLIRIFTFFGDPDRSKSLVDSLLIVCWLAGIFIVYWLLGEMTGEERNWFKVLVALCAPFLLVLFFVFGGIFLLHFFLHWAAERSIKSWLGMRTARKKQKLQNSERQEAAQKAGFYRGLTG
jgi:hypothetical protein